MIQTLEIFVLLIRHAFCCTDRYRFQAPDNDDYEVSWVDFCTAQLENFNWNHMDLYVCTRGDKEYLLTENLKYWRYRLYVLPLAMYQPYTKKILEDDTGTGRCDIYPSPTNG